MNRQITIRALTAAAGGLLGLAFLPGGVAHADDYGNFDLSPDPNSTDMIEIGGIRNALYEVPPAAQASAQGTQLFDVTDPTTGHQVGVIDVDVTNASDPFGNSNQELLVTGIESGTPGTAAGDVPTIGSIFDSYSYSSGYGSVYYDVLSPTGGSDSIAYDLVNPRGHLTATGLHYDAHATVLPVETPGAGAGFTGDTFQLDGPETINGVNGIAPADYDLLGVQTFAVDNAGGTQIGTFTAEIANSSDVAGNTTQDYLVTQSSGDAPVVGSVYDYFFSSGGSYNVYSAIPSSTPGGSDTVTDLVVNARGHAHDLATKFDAAQGLPAELNGTSPVGLPIDLPGSYDITPDASSPGTIVAIDGIQPEDIDVQGYQLFDYTDLATNQTSTFDADVAQSSVIGNTTQEQLVVTQDVSGSNAPPVGSVFEIQNSGGTEKIYSDIPSTDGGKDTITETMVGRFGGEIHLHETYDVAAGFNGDQFQNLPAAELVDSSAGADPSAAVDTGWFADAFPHLESALSLLTSLF